MNSSYVKILIKYYIDKLNAERDYNILKMKYETANEHVLRIKEREEKLEKQNDFLILINDKITFVYENIIKENRLLKKKIKKWENKFENINKTMVENKNSMKTEIKSIENRILQSIESINDQNIDHSNNMKILENKILKLNRNIQAFNSNVEEKEEEEDDGSIDRDGTSDIWHASNVGSLAGVKYWYAQDPSSINKYNEYDYIWTPLHYASKKGYLEIVNFLLSKGVYVDTKDFNNHTPLIIASFYGHVSVVEALLDKGAEINHHNYYKWTPLHRAVDGNHLAVVQVLIERGADKSITNDENKTPLARAREERDGLDRSSIIEYLTSLTH